MRIADVFYKVYSGNVNFMTPHILDYFKGEGKDKIYYIELSKGTGIFAEYIYGVTVISEVSGKFKKEQELNTCFNSKKDALEYIEELIEEVE